MHRFPHTFYLLSPKEVAQLKDNRHQLLCSL